MAETDQTEAGNAGSDGQAGPQLRVITQYVRDLSFESPNVPGSLAPQDDAPQIGVNVDVGVNPLAETDFEVVLKLKRSAPSSRLSISAQRLSDAAPNPLEKIVINRNTREGAPM